MIDTGLQRCALNQATVEHADLMTAIDATAAAGIPAIGLWRRQVEEAGVARAAAAVRAAGLTVTSLCRGGFFTQTAETAWRAALDDNRRAIDMAAELGATELVLVPGGVDDGGRIHDARARVRDSMAALVEFSSAAGVRLALEPMHPMYAADRGVVSTLGQALDMVADLPASAASVAIDSYHLWWDPDLPGQIARADREGRIGVVQVADWLGVIDGDTLRSRGIPGEGSVDFAAFSSLIAATQFDGFIECEVFNTSVWAEDPYAVARSVARAHRDLIAPSLRAAAHG